MKKHHSILALALALTLCLALLAGCNNSPSTSVAAAPSGSQPAASIPPDSGTKTADTLTVAIGSDITSIDPTGHNDTFSSLVTNMITSRLFTYDSEGNTIPDAAEKWEYTTDTELVVTIRQGITFHDGTEMKAEDVKASLERAKASELVAYVLEPVQSIDIVDDYTVKITTAAPFAPLVSNMVHAGCAILSKAQIDSGDFTTINGSGPYKFVSHQPGSQITLEAYDDYFDPAKKSVFQSLIIRVIPESSSRTIELETGGVDLVTTLDTVDYERVKSDENLTIIETVSNNINYVCFNTMAGPFTDKAVRQAMNYAIDKAAVLTVTENGIGTILDSFTPPGVLGYLPNTTYSYDPEKARQILDEAGYAEGELTVHLASYGGNRAGPVIQSNLADIGVECIVEDMDLGGYYNRVGTSAHEAILIGWTTSPDPDRFCSPLLTTSGIGSNNHSYYSNSEVDALVAQGAATMDETERAALYGQVQEIGMDDAPWVPLYSRVLIMGGNADYTYDQVLDPMGGVNFNLIRIK